MNVSIMIQSQINRKRGGGGVPAVEKPQARQQQEHAAVAPSHTRVSWRGVEQLVSTPQASVESHELSADPPSSPPLVNITRLAKERMIYRELQNAGLYLHDLHLRDEIRELFVQECWLGKSNPYSYEHNLRQSVYWRIAYAKQWATINT